MCYRLTLVLVALMAFTPAVRAQASGWTVYRWSNSGLPSDQIRALAADAAGGVWVGTAEGLTCFDGKNVWSVFTTANSPLPGGYVTALAPDGAGGVWVGTTRGLAHYDGAGAWTVHTAAGSPLPADEVTALHVDGSRLWVGTPGGFARVDGDTWTVFDEDAGLLWPHVLSITVDREGVAWVGVFDDVQHNGRIVRVDGDRVTRAYKLEDEGLSSSLPGALVVDRQGALWIGIRSTNGGALVRRPPGGGPLTVLRPSDSGLPQGGVRALALQGGALWIATGRGLAAYDGSAVWSVFDEENSGLPENALAAVAVGADGTVWAGTYNAGLAAYRPAPVGAEPGGDGRPTASLSVSPNPVRSTATVRYALPEAGPASVRVYDALGREVAALAGGTHGPGSYEVALDAARLVPGVYLVRLEAGAATQSHRVTVVH